MPARAYRLIVTRSARKEMLDLPAKISTQVERTIERLLARLSEGQRPQDMKRLQGRPQTYRLDSGEYRVLLSLDEADGVVTVIRVRHRKDVIFNPYSHSIVPGGLEVMS